MKDLAKMQAPEILPGEGMTQRRRDLASWLSDWHLIAYLETTQLVSHVRLHLVAACALGAHAGKLTG